MKNEINLMYEMRKIFNTIKRYANNRADKLHDNDLTNTQGMILGYLVENQDRDIFQRDIEAEFDIRRSTVTNIIKSIESKGYITRESVKDDARLKKIVLTDKTIEISKKFYGVIDSMDKIIKKDISEEEFDMFFKVLNKINKNLEGDE